MYPQSDNFETLQIPEPVRARCDESNKAANGILLVLETRYDLAEPSQPETSVETSEKLATVTDLNEYRQAKVDAVHDQQVPLQTSRAAENNITEIDRLKEARRQIATAINKHVQETTDVDA